MALRNLYNQNSQAFSMEDIEITHAMTLKKDSYSIKHELNPSNGDYTIKDTNGNKLSVQPRYRNGYRGGPSMGFRGNLFVHLPEHAAPPSGIQFICKKYFHKCKDAV